MTKQFGILGLMAKQLEAVLEERDMKLLETHLEQEGIPFRREGAYIYITDTPPLILTGEGWLCVMEPEDHSSPKSYFKPDNLASIIIEDFQVYTVSDSL